MAFDAQPSSLFASISEDGTNITLPIASVTDLTAAEADGTTGDWRTLMGRIIDHVYAYYNGLAPADKPQKFALRRTRSESGASIRRQYIIDWYTDEEAIDTTAE